LYGEFPKWVIAGTALLTFGTLLNLFYSVIVKAKLVLQMGCLAVLTGMILVSVGEIIWLDKESKGVR
jgi:hypothetical protein